MQTAFFPQQVQQPNQPSAGAGFQSKRKRNSWMMEDFEYEHNKLARVRSPGLDRRTTFPLQHPHSQSHPSSADNSDMDTDMDMETHMGMGMSASNGQSSNYLDQVAGFAPMQRDPAHTHSHPFGQEAPQVQVQVPQPQYQRDAQAHNYNYGFEGSSGSGGFGFGPGADDDEMSDEEPNPSNGMYPSFTPHTNPHHFSNQDQNGMFPTTVRPKSPLSAQPFSTSLHPSGQGFFAESSSSSGYSGAGMGFADLANSAGQMTAYALQSGVQPQVGPMQVNGQGQGPVGIIQPSPSEPLGWNANPVEQARAQHGPQCTSIPKLVLSQYPDAVTGKQSMWAVCRDCGAVERSS